MKFDVAIQELARTAWDWSEQGFEAQMTTLGLHREADADAEMPIYETPWGKEWAQAIIEDGKVERVEFLVENTSPGRRPFSMRKVEALDRKYRAKLAGYVKRTASVLGEPAFQGEYGTSGWPDDEDANELAMWKRESARLMLMTRNEGTDTPVWISIVIKPPIARGATARPSRPAMRAHTRQSTSTMHGARFDAALDAIANVRWDWKNLDDAVLEKLALPATRDGDRITLVVESTKPPSIGFSDDDIEELFGDYTDKHQVYAERAQRILGKPKFNDGLAARGAPKDEKAEWLALWQLKTARVMVLCTHDSEQAPFVISIVVKPR